MTTGLILGVTAAVALATTAGAYLYSIHHLQTLLASQRDTALAQGQLMRAALEHQMIENDRSLIAQMIASFGQEEDIERVMILDRQGRVHYASAPPEAGDELGLESPTCQACHRYPPERRESSQVIETGTGTLLRSVIPLPNREPCHACHDPAHRINGILIVDLDVGEIRAGINRDVRWMVAGSAALALLLILAIVVVLRTFVVRRLQRFEVAARRIAAGDLERRLPAGGSDTLAWLSREFNTMADSVTSLLEKVREQREQLETVINGIEDGIVVLDPQRKIIAANDAFLRRTGRRRESVLGASCRDLATGACATGDCPTQACLQSGESQVRICERRTVEGEVVWEEVHACPIRRGREIAQVVEVWRDISDRRAAEARLAESHRLASLGMLASGFSHELNTPLATVLTSVESILRSTGPDEPPDPSSRGRVRESAEIAREQLLRCRGIIRHFLGLSRGRGSPADLVSLQSTFTAVERLIEPTARSGGVAVEVAPVADDLRVRINESELQHVLLNLLLNAIQACERGGTVRMSALGGDPVRIRVTDNGSGIPVEDQKRIFEPFFSSRRDGTGLGLFLSLDFMRRCGGDIQVTSSPGAGSTFEVTLPSAGDSGRLRVVG